MILIANDHARDLEEQSRQAEYDRLTALPRWVRTSGKMSGAALIARSNDAATKLAN
jgi:hypothetical protein